MLGDLSLDPADYVEFQLGRGRGSSWGIDPMATDGVGIFGEDAVPEASTQAAPIDKATTYQPAEFRIGNRPYMPGNVYPEFPEQEDLSIFGWSNYPDPSVGLGGLTYAQQCQAARDACYQTAGGDQAKLAACDGVYSKCFAADPTWQITQPAAQAATAQKAVTASLMTLGVAAGLGAGVFYGIARLLKATPEHAAMWAVAGGALAPGLVVAKFVKALESPQA
jgi:hypothetical protein